MSKKRIASSINVSLTDVYLYQSQDPLDPDHLPHCDRQPTNPQGYLRETHYDGYAGKRQEQTDSRLECKDVHRRMYEGGHEGDESITGTRDAGRQVWNAVRLV